MGRLNQLKISSIHDSVWNGYDVGSDIQQAKRAISRIEQFTYSQEIGKVNSEVKDIHLEQATKLYNIRRRREAILGDIFGEGAWDMLLDLFIADRLGRTVSVSSACVASAVPPTTALRVLATIVEAGMAQRTPDAKDGRRIYVSLTPSAIEKMEALLEGGSLAPF